ncbi:acyltransferase [Amycolatopsis deserti]|uniref:Phthiocerol/phthiodiolone dimycocerosyl transferase n=1 Tax=Amycolatopsis deserti TaxID=185696 RepID=A0ABQ3JB83_9PSEU|nr:hypothetical protein [Amycolatopsis deserti]GHF08200.1 acyltransferase [Amycolatopsis deserti]
MQRELDDIEIGKLAYTPAYAVDYTGRVDHSALKQAFEVLCNRHPVLRARTIFEHGRWFLRATPDFRPSMTVLAGDDETLRRAVGEPCDAREEMAQLLLIEDGERGGAVALRANHATLDGRHLTTVFTELWQIYTQLVEGAPVAAEPGRLPDSNHAVMRDRFREMVDIPPAKPDSLGERPGYSIFQHVIELDERQSSDILRAARVRGLTVHAMLCGIIIETQLSTLVDVSEPVAFTCWSPVDLRNRVTPPVGVTDTTNFLAMHRADIAYSRSTSWHEIGQRLQKDLKAALIEKRLRLSDGALTLGSALESRPAEGERLDPHIGSASVSNYGVLPALPTPDDMRITKFHSIADRLGTPYPNFSAFTIDNSLSVINRYRSDYFTEDEVRLLVENTTARLQDGSRLLAS